MKFSSKLKFYPRSSRTPSNFSNYHFEVDSSRIPQLLHQNFLVTDRDILQAQSQVADAIVFDEVEHWTVFAATLAQEKAWKDSSLIDFSQVLNWQLTFDCRLIVVR